MAPNTTDGKILLSTFDSFYAPPIYMTTVIGYDKRKLGQTGSGVLLEVLREMVDAVVKQYPILCGTVERDSESGGMRMVAGMRSADAAPDTIFRLIEHASTNGLPSYEALQAVQFAPSRLDISKLARFSSSASHGPQPTFAVQVNFLLDGIVIAFQLHHSIADGRTLAKLANYMEGLLAQKEAPQKPELVFSLPELEANIEVGDPSKIVHSCPERYIQAGGAAVVSTQARESNTVSQMLLLASSWKLGQLHDTCCAALIGDGNPTTSPITKNDVLTAYTWAAITTARVQSGKLTSKDMSSCHIPCDVRSRVQPSIPEDYFGSATLTVHVKHPVSNLLLAAGISQEASENVRYLANIALAIRRTISGVDTAWVEHRIRLALSVEARNNDPVNSMKPKLIIKHIFDPAAHQDVVFSTLAPVFNMDNAAMQMVKPDFMRALHHSASTGVVDVMPVSEKGERIEMTLAIEEETGKVLQAIEVWGEVVEEVIL